MAMDEYSRAEMPQGASYYNQGGGYSGGYAGDQTNPEGAAADPFVYTQGSLLTPWSGRFNSGGYGGGYSVPEFNPFSYADFDYRAPSPGRFEERYEDPAAFRFADFAGPRDFKAPTAEDMKSDPGYQARMDAVTKAQRAGAAHGGVLRTGGYEKGLAKAVGDQASQEYGAVYGRRAGEHDRLRKEAESNYGINQGNTFQAFNTNVANRLAGHQTRQQDWSGNANVALQEGQLGFNIATGKWDRNMAKARQGWEDKAAHDAQVASAAAANASMSYGRDLDDYNRARDEFWTNQDRQYAILDREANRGYNAATNYGAALERGYGAQADYAVGGGDARAAGYQGSGNAWGNAFGDIGNAVGGYAMYGATGPSGGGGVRRPPGGGYGFMGGGGQ